MDSPSNFYYFLCVLHKLGNLLYLLVLFFFFLRKYLLLYYFVFVNLEIIALTS